MYALGQIHVKNLSPKHFMLTLSLLFRPDSYTLCVTIKFQNSRVSDYVVRGSFAMRVGQFGVGKGANREGIVDCDKSVRP